MHIPSTYPHTHVHVHTQTHKCKTSRTCERTCEHTCELLSIMDTSIASRTTVSKFLMFSLADAGCPGSILSGQLDPRTWKSEKH